MRGFIGTMLLCGFAFGQHPATPTHLPSPDFGAITGSTYHNNFFRFSYELPFGWVDRTSDIRDVPESSRAIVLLAIFERPPAVTGKTVNAAVIIASESVSSYPGLKTAADYFGPLTEITQSKGFQVVNEPYEFPVDGKPIVRRDFTKEIAGLPMHQSSLVLLSRGYLVSFTLIGGSDEDVMKLVEKLKFTVKPR